MDTKVSQAGQIEHFAHLITMEDHLRDGGFGSWMCEALIAAAPNLLSRIAIKALDPAVCGMVGSQKTLNALGGLSLDD